MESVLPTVIRPSSMSSFLTAKPPGGDASCALPGLEEAPFAGTNGAVAGIPGEAAGLPPRLEKFHVPEADRSSVISGLSRVNSVTCRLREKISGRISTPTFNSLARTKGCWLNPRSSPIARSCADTVLAKNERLRLPTLTGRPIAEESSVSSLGRKLLTLIPKGSAIAAATITAQTIPTICSLRFINYDPPPDQTRRLQGLP